MSEFDSCCHMTHNRVLRLNVSSEPALCYKYCGHLSKECLLIVEIFFPGLNKSRFLGKNKNLRIFDFVKKPYWLYTYRETSCTLSINSTFY